MYSVTIEPLNSIFFLTDRPQSPHLRVQEGVGLDIPSNYADWPEGALAPEQVLCVSKSDPTFYKVFRYGKEIDTGVFVPTGMNFGGVFSKRTWDRFFEGMKPLIAEIEASSDDAEACSPLLEKD